MVGARLVWVDRKFELRDFDQTRAGGGLSCICGGEKNNLSLVKKLTNA